MQRPGTGTLAGGTEGRPPVRRWQIQRLLLLPDELISRVRGLFLVVVLVNAAVVPIALSRSVGDDGWQRLVAGTALAALSWWWVVGYRRGRFPLAAEAFEAAAIYLLATGIREPLFLLSFLYVGLAYRSLYGRLSVNIVRAAAYLVAYVLAAMADETLAANPAVLLSQIPAFVMVALLMHVLAQALFGHARVAQREHALARAQADFLSATDLETIHDVALDTAAALVEGAQVVILTAGATDLRVAVATGDIRPGRNISHTGLGLGCGPASIVHLGRAESAAVRLALEIPPSELTGLAVPLCAGGQLRGAVLAWADGVDEPDVIDSFRHLASATALAMERVGLQSDLQTSEHRFRTLVQNSSDVVTIVDANTEVLYQTPSVARVLGYEVPDMLGKRLKDFIHPDDLPYAIEFFIHAKGVSGVTNTMQWRMRHADGSWRHVEVVGANLLDDPAVGGIVLTARDVSERTQLQEQLTQQAFHDPLTGLANRILFTDRVEHALSRATRIGESVGVLMVDLDDFKGVNDTLGHAVGDELLIAVAERLNACIRPGDTVARLGGDEFAILVEGVSAPDDATRVANRILDMLRTSVTLVGRELFPRVSIGIAVGGGPSGEEVDELLQMADVAMYLAKERGKGRAELFEPSMHAAVIERRSLKNDLQRAVDEDEMLVHFQPVVELATGSVLGFEALVRWWHPQRGLVAPDQFVAAAEENGVIVPLGEYVLRTACAQARQWQIQFDRPFKINVNVAWRQLQEDGFVSTVSRALHDSGLPASSLVIEITESALAHDTPATIDRLAALKALGVTLAVDDFGVGYSSLSYLRRFPIDILKIDKSFVEGVTLGAEESALARAIVKLAEALHLTTVAEGIEDADQVRELLELGCDQGQGYHFAAPLDALSLEAMLTKQADATS